MEFLDKSIWSKNTVRTIALVFLIVMALYIVMRHREVLLKTGVNVERSQSIDDQYSAVYLREGRDKVDDSGALAYLKAYGRTHRCNVPDDLDPNDPAKVTTWWQAAAMLDWFFTGDPRLRCQNKTLIGNKHICHDRKWMVTPPCLVYSFGINFNFEFDDAMAERGCEVHAFDPSMNVASHKRTSGVTFHAIGLSHVDSDGYDPRSDVYVNNVRHTVRWKVRTLESIMKMLGHKDRILDVLKIDIEASEWAVARQVMSSEILGVVRQLHVEWHIFHGGEMGNFPPLEDYILSYRTIRALRSLGWREVNSDICCYRNFSRGANLQSEVTYVNYFFDT